MVLGTAVLVLGLTGCSPEVLDQWTRFGLRAPASDRSVQIGELWFGFWVTALAIGVLMWGLMGYAAIRFRKVNEDTPKQTRYNLPMEIMYTVIPFFIIGVLFVYTIQTQDAVLEEENDDAVLTINVVGQKWSWAFNYMEADNPEVGEVVHRVGTIEDTPELVLPVNQPVRFNLHSPDVIHSFWVPEFYFKLDLIPGREASFDLTPTREGEFLGKCAELCGTYHAAMLFEVRVVSEAEYLAYVQELRDRGDVGEIRGPEGNTLPDTSEQAGGGHR